MKIMYICSSQIPVPPEKSGAVEIIVHELTKYLQEKHDVYVVSRKATSGDIKNYVIVGSADRKNKFMRIAEDFMYGLKCIGKIRGMKPDILHMHTTFTAFPIMFFKAFLPEKTRIIYTSHSPAWTVPDSEIGIANRFFNMLEGYIIKRSDTATAVAESMKKGMIDRSINKNKVITIENFTRHTARKSLKKEWKQKNKISGPIVLFVGKLTETKGFPYLFLWAHWNTNKILKTTRGKVLWTM